MQIVQAYRIVLIRYLGRGAYDDRSFYIIGIFDKDRALIDPRDLTKRAMQIHIRGSSSADHNTDIEDYEYPKEYSYGYNRFLKYARFCFHIAICKVPSPVAVIDDIRLQSTNATR